MGSERGQARPFVETAGGDRAIERELRVNERIRAREVRLIDENGAQVGVVPVREALRLARERELDLIEVSPTAQPPVCRIMDYGKHRYEVSRRDRVARKKHRPTEVRLLRLKPQIGEHDLQIKLRKLRELLLEGNKVRLNLRFRGREMSHPELGTKLFGRITQELADIAQPEGSARFEGRMMNLLLGARPGVRPPAKAAAPAKKAAPAPVERVEQPVAAVPAPAAQPVAAASVESDAKQEQVARPAQAEDAEDSGEAG